VEDETTELRDELLRLLEVVERSGLVECVFVLLSDCELVENERTELLDELLGIEEESVEVDSTVMLEKEDKPLDDHTLLDVVESLGPAVLDWLEDRPVEAAED
jgi:hypothetical protein